MGGSPATSRTCDRGASTSVSPESPLRLGIVFTATHLCCQGSTELCRKKLTFRRTPYVPSMNRSGSVPLLLANTAAMPEVTGTKGISRRGRDERVDFPRSVHDDLTSRSAVPLRREDAASSAVRRVPLMDQLLLRSRARLKEAARS